MYGYRVRDLKLGFNQSKGIYSHAQENKALFNTISCANPANAAKANITQNPNL